MHPFDVIIVISAATAVGYTASIYAEDDALLVLGYMVFSVIGAFAASFLALWYLPETDKFGIVFGAMLGAALAVLPWRWVRKRFRCDCFRWP